MTILNTNVLIEVNSSPIKNDYCCYEITIKSDPWEIFNRKNINGFCHKNDLKEFMAFPNKKNLNIIAKHSNANEHILVGLVPTARLQKLQEHKILWTHLLDKFQDFPEKDSWMLHYNKRKHSHTPVIINKKNYTIQSVTEEYLYFEPYFYVPAPQHEIWRKKGEESFMTGELSKAYDHMQAINAIHKVKNIYNYHLKFNIAPGMKSLNHNLEGLLKKGNTYNALKFYINVPDKKLYTMAYDASEHFIQSHGLFNDNEGRMLATFATLFIIKSLEIDKKCSFNFEVFAKNQFGASIIHFNNNYECLKLFADYVEKFTVYKQLDYTLPVGNSAQKLRKI